MSIPRVGARAARKSPTTTALSTIRRARRFPIMSPVRPSNGVAMAADSSQAVMTQVTSVWVVCRSCWMVGSTGFKSDCRRENEAVAVARTAKVSQ